MNEEEKNAFKELSKKAVLCNYEERDYPNMICFKKGYAYSIKSNRKTTKRK